jgi:hypothetical protein
MRSIGRPVFAALAVLILAAVGTFFLRGKPKDLPGRPVTPPSILPGDLELQSKNLAGPEAVDCGRVLIQGNPKIATECALKAQKAGKPFRVRFDLQGIDSFVAVGFVRTQDGTVESLMWDSDPSGGGRRGPGVVFVKKCPEPVRLWVGSDGRVGCSQGEASPQKDPMSPIAEPY